MIYKHVLDLSPCHKIKYLRRVGEMNFPTLCMDKKCIYLGIQELGGEEVMNGVAE